MKKQFVCIVCPVGCVINTEDETGEIKISGNTCKRGYDYVLSELTYPTRVITALMKIKGKSKKVLSVKTSAPIPKEKIWDVMAEINQKSVAPPVQIGDVIIKDVLSLGVDIVATREA